MSPRDDEREPEHETKPFVEHLWDLRRALVWSLLALAAGVGIAIPLSPAILSALKWPLAQAGRDPDQFLQVLGVTGGLSTAIRLSLWGGIVLSAPLIALAVGNFVFPGLKRRERQAVLRGLGFGVVLFAGGVALCYFLVLPVALAWMLKINEWLGIDCRFVELAGYVGFVLKLLLAFGLAFEFPVVVVALGSVGLVSSAQLRDKRRHVIVIIFIVAMILTPPDPFSQILMAIPMVALYEACVWIVWAGERKRRD